jgi:prevent-host-death family protein
LFENNNSQIELGINRKAIMPRTVTSTEAQNRFASMMQWAKEHREGVVVEVRGQPQAVILSYDDYTEYIRLRKLETQRHFLDTLDEMRAAIQKQGPPLSPEEAYRLAGFSEEVIRETLAADKRWNNPS